MGAFAQCTEAAPGLVHCSKLLHLLSRTFPQQFKQQAFFLQRALVDVSVTVMKANALYGSWQGLHFVLGGGSGQAQMGEVPGGKLSYYTIRVWSCWNHWPRRVASDYPSHT
jgi:hypothetical protein